VLKVSADWSVAAVVAEAGGARATDEMAPSADPRGAVSSLPILGVPWNLKFVCVWAVTPLTDWISSNSCKSARARYVGSITDGVPESQLDGVFSVGARK
jgi:hypothetical protein